HSHDSRIELNRDKDDEDGISFTPENHQLGLGLPNHGVGETLPDSVMPPPIQHTLPSTTLRASDIESKTPSSVHLSEEPEAEQEETETEKKARLAKQDRHRETLKTVREELAECRKDAHQALMTAHPEFQAPLDKLKATIRKANQFLKTQPSQSGWWFWGNMPN